MARPMRLALLFGALLARMVKALRVPSDRGPASPPLLASTVPSGPDGTSIITTTRSELPGEATTSGPTLSTPAPGATDSPSPSSEVLVTDTMPTADIATSAAPQTTTDISSAATTPSDGGSGAGTNKTLVIALSTVLSVVGLVLFAGAFILFWRGRRQRRIPFLSRGVSPIDDDEIERWKGHRGEKLGGGFQTGGETDAEADAPFHKETLVGGGGGSPTQPSHAKHSSTSSAKKPPSVIVYNTTTTTSSANNSPNLPRHSTDADSRRSFAQNHPAYAISPTSPYTHTTTHHHSHSQTLSGGSTSNGGRKTSFDSHMKALPQTPIQARAPNSRAGLTDESVPGDEPFLPSPKRTASRLSKHHHHHHHHQGSGGGGGGRHARARSSRSSTRSFGEYTSSGFYGVGFGGGGGGKGGDGEGRGSEVELSPTRHSHDQVVNHYQQQQQVGRSSSGGRRSRSRSRSYGGGISGGGGVGGSHSRVYSSSSIPPRLSFGEDGGVVFAAAGLSSPVPPTPTARPVRLGGGGGEGGIGRAIG